jgi:hypothetical protein
MRVTRPSAAVRGLDTTAPRTAGTCRHGCEIHRHVPGPWATRLAAAASARGSPRDHSEGSAAGRPSRGDRRGCREEFSPALDPRGLDADRSISGESQGCREGRAAHPQPQGVRRGLFSLRRPQGVARGGAPHTARPRGLDVDWSAFRGHRGWREGARRTPPGRGGWTSAFPPRGPQGVSRGACQGSAGGAGVAARNEQDEATTKNPGTPRPEHGPKRGTSGGPKNTAPGPGLEPGRWGPKPHMLPITSSGKAAGTCSMPDSTATNIAPPRGGLPNLRQRRLRLRRNRLGRRDGCTHSSDAVLTKTTFT